MDRTEKPRPRVVLIAAEQALLGTDRPWLERMGAISLPARGVMNAFPAWTTTLVTGVDPLVHDIVDSMVIDPETLETRAVNSGDCRFSTIWLEGASHGLATASIDWPASNLSKQISNVITPSEMTALTNRRTPLPEDLKLAHTTAAGLDDPEAQERWKPRLTAMLGRTRGTLEAARNALASDTPPDLLTLAIRDSRQFANAGGDARPARTAMRALLQAFIENIPANTTCIVVEHRMADRNRKPVESDSHQGLFEFHVFGLSAEHDTKTTHSIKSTATAIRNMLGLPNPLGASNVGWPFVMADDPGENARPIPAFFEEQSVDHVDIAQRVMALPRDTPETRKNFTTVHSALVRQAGERLRIAMLKFEWNHVIPAAKTLTIVRGQGSDYWHLFNAQEREQLKSEMRETCTEMQAKFPDMPMTRIAEATCLLPTDPDQARTILEEMNTDGISMPLVCSGAGRLAAALGMHELAVNLLQRVIADGRPIPIDRLVLGRTLSRLGRPEDALSVLGPVGRQESSLEAQLFRAELHLKLQQPTKAAEISQRVLRKHPANQLAKSIANRAAEAISSS